MAIVHADDVMRHTQVKGFLMVYLITLGTRDVWHLHEGMKWPEG